MAARHGDGWWDATWNFADGANGKSSGHSTQVKTACDSERWPSNYGGTLENLVQMRKFMLFQNDCRQKASIKFLKRTAVRCALAQQVFKHEKLASFCRQPMNGSDHCRYGYAG